MYLPPPRPCLFDIPIPVPFGCCVQYSWQIRFYLSQWYGISQEDVDTSTGRIDETERPTTTYEREYNQKLLYLYPLQLVNLTLD